MASQNYDFVLNRNMLVDLGYCAYVYVLDHFWIFGYLSDMF